MVLGGMFGQVTQDMLADIEKRVTWHHIPREGILFWQGESSDRVFVVISGRLQVLSTSDAGEQRVVEEIVQDGAVGEAGVFAGGTQATCVLVSSAKTDDLLGVSGISQAAGGSPDDLSVRAWLDQHETRYRYVIYLADSDVTNWTRRCVRQADEVIALGIAEASPEIAGAEAEVLREERARRVEARKSLLLLHRTRRNSTARPAGASRLTASIPSPGP